MTPAAPTLACLGGRGVAVRMVEILDADEVQRQVLELFHQSPEFWIVSHRGNNTRAAVVARLDPEVIDETDQ